jgi:carboxypeptidase family protein
MQDDITIPAAWRRRLLRATGMSESPRMNRLQTRLFIAIVITNLMATAAACGGSNRQPIAAPTGPTGPTAPTGPTYGTYTISGVISEYRGGPVSGVTVYATSPNGDAQTTTSTNQQGSYSFPSPSVGPVLVSTWKTGYEAAYKINVSAEHSAHNFAIDRGLKPDPLGGPVEGIIWGDEFLSGDDVFFGGLCLHTACREIDWSWFGDQQRAPRVEVRLRWADPTRQLALYHSRLPDWEEGFPPASQPPDRYCCSSALVAPVQLQGANFHIVIAFEQSGGGPPGPGDSQLFELTVRPIHP